VVAPPRPLNELPGHYGLDFLVVMPRDPDSLFAYWEVREEVRSRVGTDIGRDATARLHDVLRVIVADPSGDHAGDVCWTIDLPPYASSWYVDVGRPNHRVQITLGVHDGSAGFYPLLPAVEIFMPGRGPSADEGVSWARSGDHGLEPLADAAQERPSADATERLIRHARSASAGASHDWAAAHRLVDIDFGGHSSPH
jgi:hypothetical protein